MAHVLLSAKRGCVEGATRTATTPRRARARGVAITARRVANGAAGKRGRHAAAHGRVAHGAA